MLQACTRTDKNDENNKLALANNQTQNARMEQKKNRHISTHRMLSMSENVTNDYHDDGLKGRANVGRI